MMKWIHQLDLVLMKWVHSDPEDINKIERRALMVTLYPFFLGFGIACLIILIIEYGGRL